MEKINGLKACSAPAMRTAWNGKRITVKAEFELLSRNFAEHGHDPTGWNLIVYGKHNSSGMPGARAGAVQGGGERKGAFSEFRQKGHNLP